MKALTDRAKKLLWISIAAVCVVVGFLTVWTPLPTGIPLLAVGIVILVTVSATARRMMRRARERSHRVDRGVVFVEERANRTMATMLKRTRPLARKLEAKRAMRAADKALKSSRAGGEPKPRRTPSGEPNAR